MLKYFSFTRFVHFIFLKLSFLPMRGHFRWKFLKYGGVHFLSKSPHVCIYDNVLIDTVRPDLLTIGNNVTITSGTKILTHFLDSSQYGKHFKYGPVVIEDDVFIGMNTIICNSVTIGKGAIIGAGSIVTKNVPSNEIWAGNPARFIKNRH